jgi:hypothetical protein
MQERLESRLGVLKQEFETGQGRLRELELEESRLRETLLRISGAILVLEELLAERSPGDDNRSGTLEAQPVSSQPAHLGSG